MPERIMETATERQEISVELHDSSFGPDPLVVLLDSTQIAYHRIYLTASEAASLGAWLVAAAAEAMPDRDQAVRADGSHYA